MKIRYTSTCLDSVHGEVEVCDGATEEEQIDAILADTFKFNIAQLDWDITELEEVEDE